MVLFLSKLDNTLVICLLILVEKTELDPQPPRRTLSYGFVKCQIILLDTEVT